MEVTLKDLSAPNLMRQRRMSWSPRHRESSKEMPLDVAVGTEQLGKIWELK